MAKTLVTLKNGRQKLLPSQLADELVKKGKAFYPDAAPAKAAAPKPAPAAVATATPKAPTKKAAAKVGAKAPAKKKVAKPMTLSSYGRRDMRATKKGK